MATKKFALNKEPHVADIDGQELRFQPEVMGDDFMDALGELREAQKAAHGIDMDDLSSLDPTTLKLVARGLRTFLASMMLEESAALFLRLNVVKDGEVLEVFQDWEAAAAFAEQVEGGGAKVVDHLRYPDRVLVQLMEWVTELYGGDRPPTRSGGSAKASPPAGRRGTGASPSMGPTRTRGR